MDLAKYAGTKIKYLRSSHNMTQSDLADKLNIGKSAISNYESGYRMPKQDLLFDLSNFFEVDLDYFFPQKEETITITSIYNQLTNPRQKKVYNFAERQLEEQNNSKIVPILGQTAAGEALAYGDIIVEEREVSFIPKGAECALAVKGHSMEPDFKNGSVVFYKNQPHVENGEIAVVEIEGTGVTLKKVKYDYEKEKVILQSLNKEFNDMIFENSQIRILGKVVK